MPLTKAYEKRNVRIAIGELVNACRTLGETQVIAAGSMYATLLLDDDDCERLSRVGISWQYD